MGKPPHSLWRTSDSAAPLVTGAREPETESEAWEWIRNPLPPGDEHACFQGIRLLLGLGEPGDDYFSSISFGDLAFPARQHLEAALEPGFFREHNPVVRHTVLRRRHTLEEKGLLEKVGVNVHPDQDAGPGTYPGAPFEGLGLMTNHPFDRAYEAAEGFCRELQRRDKSAGFMKTMMLQRICSSFESGRATAERMIARRTPEEEEDGQAELMAEELEAMTPLEMSYLDTILEELSRPEARDPKLAAVKSFLTEQVSDDKTWLEHGCIIFSQYYDTARWIGSKLALELPDEPIAVYAGTGKSGLFRNDRFTSIEREDIKAAVKKREIQLVVATDAACEGLNLQTLGTLINVDLPWNPSRLEQRLGRIKRFGQARRNVDMLNLVYSGTQDETVFGVLSRRMKDRYDIFGGLPDVIEDDWIISEEKLEEMLDQYVHLRDKARDVFQLRYEESVDPDKDRWELCARVLSRRDVLERLSKPW